MFRSITAWPRSKNISRITEESPASSSQRIPDGFCRVHVIRRSPRIALRQATKSAATLSRLGARRWSSIRCRNMCSSVTLLGRLRCWSFSSPAQAWWQCWKATLHRFARCSGLTDRNYCSAGARTTPLLFGISAVVEGQLMNCRDIKTRCRH